MAGVEGLPQVVGTVPQWAMFLTLFVAAIKLVPVLRQQTLDADTSHAASWQKECENLRAALKAQQDQCHADNEVFRKEITRLNEELFGMRKQHITEQIELINVIMNSVDAPQLKGMLRLLERVQTQLAAKGIGAYIHGTTQD